jgi:putative transposase
MHLPENRIGRHRKSVRHFHEKGDLHELTFSCFQRRPLLLDDGRCEKLAWSIDSANIELDVKLVAFVFMPEHVHLLVAPMPAEPDIGIYLARIKQPFSKLMKEDLSRTNPDLLQSLTIRERPGKFCFRFWQEGPGFDRNLFEMESIQASIDYIHRNPVERELCRTATDWTWSSALYYLGDPPCQQQPGWPLVHGLKSVIDDR